jgi:hypothetical protein
MRIHPLIASARLTTALLSAAGLGFAAPSVKTAAAPASHPMAAPSAKPAAAPLDTSRIHKLYMESEFDAAIAVLESDLKGRWPLTHADSVFIYKYLGVMYTSKYDSREVGKRYMYQLLVMEPSARINELFASDMIYMIFKNVQDEYFSTHPHDAPPPPPPPHPHDDPEQSTGHAGWYWAGGAVVVIAAGATAYVLLNRPQDKKNVHPVTEPTK